MLSGRVLTSTCLVKFIVGVFVIERRSKAPLMPAQPSDNAAAADRATSPHSPAAKDSPNITPVRSKSGVVFVASVVTFFIRVPMPPVKSWIFS